MALISRKIVRMFAGGAFLMSLCAPAMALDVEIGGIEASVGTSGGGVGASVSAGGVSAGASVGGTGVNASVSAAGTSASVGASVGPSTNVGVSVGTTPSKPSTPTTPTANAGPKRNGVVPKSLAGMSRKEIAAYKKRCVDVLAHPSRYDRSLRQLCQLIRTASR
jgi:hypothetical protein